MTRVILLSLIALLLSRTTHASAVLGSVLSVGTGLLPPEMRGVSGTLANAAMASANKKKGIIEFVMDGSDYPYICLCATAQQIKDLFKQTGTTIAPDKCPADKSMGCYPPQIDMSSQPLPTISANTNTAVSLIASR